MRIAMITPGSGGQFYCENCRRDLDLVQALRRQGHDAVLLPMYLPVAEAGADEGPPVFYGALNVYLSQVVPGFRHLPPAWRDWLDASAVLGWVSRRAGSVRAGGLGALTLSVLRGESGRQAGDLDRLVAWLRQECRPEVVHLSNALLLGLAGRIRAEVGVPVVCSLQDEDSWVEAMPGSWPARLWDAMAVRAVDVDLFLPVSRSYGAALAPRLRLAPERLHAVWPGIDAGACRPAAPPAAPRLGYYARLAEALGLGVLAEALVALRRRPAWRDLELHAAGGCTADDRAFLKALRRRLERDGAASAVTIQERFVASEVASFMDGLSLLCVPVPGGEAFGMFTLEALARGVPAVLPAAGGFVEVAEATGGVELYAPDDPGALIAALERVLADAALRRRLAEAGRARVQSRFDLQNCTVPALLAAYTAAGARSSS
ncbi:MAG: glycosyltransferase family 4 protein [Lentisphaerae bacterium]|nr:glycosyltransferase family 4 protein [Lentisphaerota bacterium]